MEFIKKKWEWTGKKASHSQRKHMFLADCIRFFSTPNGPIFPARKLLCCVAVDVTRILATLLMPKYAWLSGFAYINRNWKHHYISSSSRQVFETKKVTFQMHISSCAHIETAHEMGGCAHEAQKRISGKRNSWFHTSAETQRKRSTSSLYWSEKNAYEIDSIDRMHSNEHTHSLTRRRA